MIEVLQASHNNLLYRRHVHSVDDIADLVREDHVEALTSHDGQIDFWFTPSTRPGHRCVNRTATEMLLATTYFTASDVPLMRGIVICAAHDTRGELIGLTGEQFDRLAAAAAGVSWWGTLRLACRYARDQRGQRRADQAAQKVHITRAACPPADDDDDPL